ncbi:uncharacterized protein LOC118770070 isoform X2 [Megalops cyprinoides]|uniref:uncharacterized protein LOC118770070 isoform X2 n=1 Tax=Megalops cyprinoides TaxID=118141 RepID=UPI0018642E8C|nr:uncharacterized protein LOC118770070 isoform X2 [Megalops cyprinoides]
MESEVKNECQIRTSKIKYLGHIILKEDLKRKSPIGLFIDELDMLLSSLPDTPLILLGDFNIQPESTLTASMLSLLPSFSLTLSPSSATHKAGNQLDLVLTKNCATSHFMVTPLHMSSVPLSQVITAVALLPMVDRILSSDRAALWAAERKWRKSRSSDDLASYHSLLTAFTAATTTAKSSFFQNKINSNITNPRNLLSTFCTLISPPPPPPLLFFLQTTLKFTLRGRCPASGTPSLLQLPQPPERHPVTTCPPSLHSATQKFFKSSQPTMLQPALSTPFLPPFSSLYPVRSPHISLPSSTHL